jgi:hypothetical protein
MTTYFGKDYGDGRGLAPPDNDNNCQVEIVVYDIDGAYNIGGYFSPGTAPTRDVVYVDFADITLNWGNSNIYSTTLRILTKTYGSMKAMQMWQFTCVLEQIVLLQAISTDGHSLLT